jgi:hypothetical protein
MEHGLGAAILALNLWIPGAPAAPAVLSVQPDAATAVPAVRPGVLREAIARDSRRLPTLVTRSRARRAQSAGAPKNDRNWIERHPSCVGAAIGFTAGFLIGFLPGDDAVFDDFTAAFNGAVLGGIGAGAGAIIGWIAGRD